MTHVGTLLAQWSPSAARWQAWAVDEPALAGHDLRSLSGLLLSDATLHDRRDDVLAALLRLSRTDNEAAVALIVCLLPGLSRLAHRLGRGVDDEARADLWSELVAQTFAHIRTYDLVRRPSKIAANLLLDAMSHTLRALRVEWEWVAATCPLDVALLPAAHPPDEPCPVGLGVERGVLSARDAALITSTRLDGVALRAAAHVSGASYEAVKKRRHRAERALLRWLHVTQHRAGDSPARSAGRSP